MTGDPNPDWSDEADLPARRAILTIYPTVLGHPEGKRADLIPSPSTPVPKVPAPSRAGLCENAFRDPVRGWSHMTYCTRPAATKSTPRSPRRVCRECAEATAAKIQAWTADVWAFWVRRARDEGCDYCGGPPVAILPPRTGAHGICAACIPDANEVGIIPGLIDMEVTP